jgi:hypothetical protein
MMTNCKLQDQLGDAFSSLEQVAGPSGRIHVLVEVEDEDRLNALLPHAREIAKLGEGAPVSLTVKTRGKLRLSPAVVRWVLGGE